MLTIAFVTVYVATKCIDQFIKEEGYGRIKKFFFPTTTYSNRLGDLIMKVVDEYKVMDPIVYSDKIPFYHSPEVFKAMMDHVLFKEIGLTDVLNEIERNPKVQPPESIDVKAFFDFFYRRMKADSKLKKVFIEENYKSEIFEISNALNSLDAKISSIAKDVTSIESKINFNGESSTGEERPIITADYVTAPEERKLMNIISNKQVLLLSGVSFCGKSQLAKRIAEQFILQGYKYQGGAEVGEADRFLRTPGGNHIYLLEDPFGHNIETEAKINVRKVEELIRNLAPGNKLIVTSRSEVVTSIMGASGLPSCSLEGHSWAELTIRSRAFLIRVWEVLSQRLPDDCHTLIENHLKSDEESRLLQVGQLAHLSRLPVDTIRGMPIETLLHMARADSRTLSVDIRNKGAVSSQLYTIIGLAATTTIGIGVDDLAYILADTSVSPGFLKMQGLRTHNPKRSEEVSFPDYDQKYALSSEIQSELSFFISRGYLLFSNGQVYFRHPTYLEASRYLLIGSSVFEIDFNLKKIKRTLACLAPKNATYLASQLATIYKTVQHDDLKKGLIKMAYKKANQSIFPSVRDWMLKFLLEFVSDMNEEMQDGTFQLINADMSSSDIFWNHDQPFYSKFDRDIFEADYFDVSAATLALASLNSTEEISALKLWLVVRLISKSDFALTDFPTEAGIHRILNAGETFIRSKMAYVILKRIPSIDQSILERIFGDTNPWVVVEGIRGSIFGYPDYTEEDRERILPLLQKAVTNGFVIARIRTLLTSFGIDYGLDHIDWDLIDAANVLPMWELWAKLFPIFMENMPVSVSIYNSGRFGQTMNASIEHLKNTELGLRVAESFYLWVDARIANGLSPDTHELGVVSYLLEVSDDHTARLPLFEKIFQYSKSSLILYSLSWTISYWDELCEKEKEIILSLCCSDRIDKRWIVATAITRREVPGEIQFALFNRTTFLDQNADEIVKELPQNILSDAFEVFIGESYLISQLGISHSRSEKWDEIMVYILRTGHEPDFHFCLQEFVVDVLNGPAEKWKNNYVEIWQTMCSQEHLKVKLSDQLIYETVRSNPSIPPCKDLWKHLIELHPGESKLELAAKVASAIEGIQRHDPRDIFDFFDGEFLDMILQHCPLDLKILSVLLKRKDEPMVSTEAINHLADEIESLVESKTIRLHLTFDIIDDYKVRESANPKFAILSSFPNRITEIGNKWLSDRRMERQIQDWISY